MAEEGECAKGGEGEESFSALVLASFEPQDPAELRVDENDTITVFTSPAPEGWCFGEKGGEKGLVPSEFVGRIYPATMLADFTAECEIEMSVSEGESVLVLPRPAAEGWASVRRGGEGGEEGLVPRDYLSLDRAGAVIRVEELLRHAQPALVIADFYPERSMEMRVKAGQLVLALERMADAPDWTTVTRLDDPSQPPGLVPSAFLQVLGVGG